MAVILWVLGVSLLMQVCLCRPGQTAIGCMTWRQSGDNICCEACHPGNRLVSECGPKPQDLCKPCEPETYTVKPLHPSCLRCTQCVGAQVLLKECTTTTDTQCGCKEGLICGNPSCTFCVMKCNKGQEPTEDRSCRPCPEGTFNDQIHQKCKPFSTKCPKLGDKIVAKGNATSDIKCDPGPTHDPNPSKRPAPPEQAWPLVLSVITSVVLVVFGLTIVIIVVTLKIHQKRKTRKNPTPKKPIIVNPTDDPRTLIAIECSFHEAQQEQGSSSESLASKDSSEQLIG